MKNKGYIFFIVLMNLLSSCRTVNKVFIFGELNNDIKLLLDNSSDKKINYVFTSSKMYSNHIYKMVSNNSYIYINNKEISFNKSLKKTSYLPIMFIGYSELLPYIKISNNDFIIDTKEVDKQLELIDYNVTNIIRIIKEEYNRSLYIFGPIYNETFAYPEEVLFKTFLVSYEDVLKETCILNNIEYISCLSSKNEEIVSMIKSYL